MMPKYKQLHLQPWMRRSLESEVEVDYIDSNVKIGWGLGLFGGGTLGYLGKCASGRCYVRGGNWSGVGPVEVGHRRQDEGLLLQ